MVLDGVNGRANHTCVASKWWHLQSLVFSVLKSYSLQMIDDIKKTLWASADKLRANMDAAEYKHLVLGLIFVK